MIVFVIGAVKLVKVKNACPMPLVVLPPPPGLGVPPPEDLPADGDTGTIGVEDSAPEHLCREGVRSADLVLVEGRRHDDRRLCARGVRVDEREADGKHKDRQPFRSYPYCSHWDGPTL